MAAMRILQERKVAVLCRVVGSSFSGGSKPTAYVRSLARDRPSNVEFKDFQFGPRSPRNTALRIFCAVRPSSRSLLEA